MWGKSTCLSGAIMFNSNINTHKMLFGMFFMNRAGFSLSDNFVFGRVPRMVPIGSIGSI